MSDDYDEQPTTALPRPPGYGADPGYGAAPGAGQAAGQAATDWTAAPGADPSGHTARYEPWGGQQQYAAEPPPYPSGPYQYEPGQYGPAGTGVETRPGGGRRGPGDRRWIWLAGLIGFALLAVAGLITLIAVQLPGNKPHQTVTLGRPSPTVTAPQGTKPASTTPANQPSPTIPVHTKRPTLPPPITATPPLDTSTPTGGPPTPTRPGQGQQVTVPNVVGLPVQQATARLQAAGFTPRVVSAPIGRPQQANRVFLQSPRGGQTAPRGSVVTIVISAPLQPR